MNSIISIVPHDFPCDVFSKSKFRWAKWSAQSMMLCLDTVRVVSVCVASWQTTRCGWAIAVIAWTRSSGWWTISCIIISTGSGFASALGGRCIWRVFWARVGIVWISGWLSLGRVRVWILLFSGAATRWFITNWVMTGRGRHRVGRDQWSWWVWSTGCIEVTFVHHFVDLLIC